MTSDTKSARNAPPTLDRNEAAVKAESATYRQQAATAAAPTSPSNPAPTVSLPRPTTDQENYLEGIKRATGRFDPNVVVGGPRRPSA
jgi:hypothetical protein